MWVYCIFFKFILNKVINIANNRIIQRLREFKAGTLKVSKITINLFLHLTGSNIKTIT